MNKLIRKLARAALERLYAARIIRLGRRSFAVVPNAREELQRWLSLEAQLAALIDSHAICLVLDVGANTGQFALETRHFYSGELHSFEPLTRAFEELQKASMKDEHWCVHRLAVGNENRTETLNIASSSDFSSMLTLNSFAVTEFGTKAQSVGNEVVQTRRLDCILSDLGCSPGTRNILLKTDTQGFDLNVIHGLGSWIDDVCVIVVEVSLVPIYADMPHWTTVIGYLESKGFRVAGLYPISWSRGALIEADCVLIKQASTAPIDEEQIGASM